jgi:hypothetical protein
MAPMAPMAPMAKNKENNMRRSIIASAGLLIGGTVAADNLTGVDRMLCATGELTVCIEGDDCYAIQPSEVDVPQFVIVDVKAKTLSTTKASARQRTTAIQSVSRADGLIYLQGVDNGRAFSFVVDEEIGRLTVAVSRDGVTVTMFGNCTTAES